MKKIYSTTNAVVDSEGMSWSTEQAGSAIQGVEPSVPAAKIGQLTTRTDGDTGILTMNSGHGITNAQKLDVFWPGGRRRNMTVGTVATNSVPIDGGSGDNLPVNLTAITAMVPLSQAFLHNNSGSIDVGFYVYSVCRGYIVFVDGGGDIANATFTLDADTGLVWTLTGFPVMTNPIDAKNVLSIKFSHGEITPQTMKAGAMVA